MQPKSQHISYPAKLLLFGEYTIIGGGSALAIPYPQYEGRWEESAENSDLEGFFGYLKSLEGCNLNKVAQAEQENWIFRANIPLGYGLGSSGALSAAAYGTFFEEEALSLEELKGRLAEVESFFHGKSSGLDPLVSYTGQAVHIQGGKISTLEPPSLPDNLRLYDSGQTRNGKPLIKAFLQRVEREPEFAEVVNELRQLNDEVAEKFLAGNHIGDLFEKISRLQFDHFRAMIPQGVYKDWEAGLDKGSYMKLSGAGGGGYYLVMDS